MSTTPSPASAIRCHRCSGSQTRTATATWSSSAAEQQGRGGAHGVAPSAASSDLTRAPARHDWICGVLVRRVRRFAAVAALALVAIAPASAHAAVSFSAHGSVEQVYATGLPAGAGIVLVDGAGR